MRNPERRELVERYLDELRSQRDVDLRDALEELIHLTLELDDGLGGLEARVSALEERSPRTD
jgi:hypothetical protein